MFARLCLPILRTAVLRTRCTPIRLPLARLTSPLVQIRSFSSSNVVLARRTKKDEVDVNSSESYDDQEEADEEDEDTEQVRRRLRGIAIGCSFPYCRPNKRRSERVSSNTNYQKVWSNRLMIGENVEFELLGYRIILKHLASLRLDLICSAGTGIGRR